MFNKINNYFKSKCHEDNLFNDKNKSILDNYKDAEENLKIAKKNYDKIIFECNRKKYPLYKYYILFNKVFDKCILLNATFLYPIVISYLIPKSVIAFYNISDMVKTIKKIRYFKENYENKKLKKKIIFYFNTYIKYILSIFLQIIEIIGCITCMMCIFGMTKYRILKIIMLFYIVYNIVLISVGSYLLDYWNKISKI